MEHVTKLRSQDIIASPTVPDEATALQVICVGQHASPGMPEVRSRFASRHGRRAIVFPIDLSCTSARTSGSVLVAYVNA